ncbi:MAG: hypothetical protein JJT78_04705 [Leptospira sp.]|nr:hypothetical protein [Leptospira sp.]
MIILHGIYDRGKVIITDSNLPDIKASVEIVIKKKSWQREGRRVRLESNDVASDIIVNMRED